MSKQPTVSRSFASDNNAGVHPEVIDAISRANTGHVVAYGDDAYTARAVKAFEKQLGKNIAVFFVFGGTGANVLGLQAMTNSYQASFAQQQRTSMSTNVVHRKNSPGANFSLLRHLTENLMPSMSNLSSTQSASNIMCNRV